MAQVQRDPAHELGVQEVPRLAANLPDALVLLGPAARGGVRRGGQELLCYRVQLAEPIDQPPLCGVENSPYTSSWRWVHAPFPTRTAQAVPPPGQVRQLPLGQVSLAADPEHDLQVRAPPQLGGRRVG